MGRLSGGAHEISGIKTPLFLHGGWLEGSWGGWVSGLVVVGWVGGWVGGGGGVGPHDTPHVIFDNLVKKLDQIVKKITWGHHGWCQMPLVIPPHHGGHQTPPMTPHVIFGNLVKKLDNLSL